MAKEYLKTYIGLKDKKYDIVDTTGEYFYIYDWIENVGIGKHSFLLDIKEEVFKKYAINKDVEKFRDSAILISYKKFRKDFQNVIKSLDKTPDSLQITIRKELGKNYQAKRFKINW